MAKKFKTYVSGGNQKVIVPDSTAASSGTTIAEFGNATVSLAQLAQYLGITSPTKPGVPVNPGTPTAGVLVAGPGLAGGGPIGVGSVEVHLRTPSYPAISDDWIPEEFWPPLAAPSSGSGGGALTVKDGTTTVSNVTTIKFIGSATVSTPTLGEADVTVTGGGGGAGLPSTIPDCVYWWDGNNTNITIGKLNQRFPDSNPYSANHGGNSSIGAVVRSASNLNSKPTFTWPGNSGGRISWLSGVILHQGTFFWVGRTKAGGTQAFNVSGSAGALQITQDASNNKIALVKATITLIGESNALAANTAMQLNGTFDDTTGNYAFRIASTADLSGTNLVSGGITQPTQSWGYNQANTSEDAVGDHAELIVYSRVLTLTEIQSVEAYLLAKWGV